MTIDVAYATSLDAIRAKLDEDGYFFSEQPIGGDAFERVCADLGPIINKSEIRVEAGATTYFKRKDPLPYHTDSPFARYVAWRCEAQQDIGGEMRLKDTKPLFDAAPLAQTDALRRAMVRFPAIKGAHEAGRLPALSGDSRRGWRLNYAPWLISKDTLAPAGRALVAALDEFPGGDASVAIPLRPGSLLIIDNRRMLHGRGELDGDKRVLLRFWIGD
ncbi:TauD/TfdA family dioxygenase [Methylocystis sp. JAN1]|uniref:TauD/TfdA family dioxygenase n=1 Tax=Methylocystis sp. JAN1 TaxID=3397211 RepID=UPI003FA311E5